MTNWIGFVVGFLILGGGIAQVFRGATHDNGGIWRSYWLYLVLPLAAVALGGLLVVYAVSS